MSKPSVSTPNATTGDGVTSLAGHRMALVVQKARQIREASDAFAREWPTLEVRPQMPAFAWPELERQLLSLAPEELAPMVRDLVSAVRKEASPKPPEMVLREVLIIAATVLDEGFHEKWAEDTTMP